MTSQQTAGPPPHIKQKGKKIIVNENRKMLQNVLKEIRKFERTAEEIHLLKRIAEDLKSYRKMIKLKKYD